VLAALTLQLGSAGRSRNNTRQAETDRLEVRVGGWVAAFEQNRLFRNHAALSDMVKQLAVLVSHIVFDLCRLDCDDVVQEHHSVACGTHIISEDFEQLRQVQNKVSRVAVLC
jgi:hypothetical protein